MSRSNNRQWGWGEEARGGMQREGWKQLEMSEGSEKDQGERTKEGESNRKRKPGAGLLLLLRRKCALVSLCQDKQQNTL